MERHAVLYFDGSYTPHGIKTPVDVSYGGWFAEIGGDISFSAFDGFENRESSSTKAEWMALLGGLTWLRAMFPFTHIDIRGDCEAVINPLANRQLITKSKSSDMAIALRVIAIIDEISDSYNATKITRQQNKIPHLLARKMTPASRIDKKAAISNIKKSTIPVIATKALAEYLWRSAGQPVDRDIHFWLAAEKFIAKI